MIRRLNLGCGDAVIGDALNIDIRTDRDDIVVCDLNQLPWPWQNSSWDHIIAKAIFEHLDMTLLEAMNEAWRIMAPGGLLEVKLPYWHSEQSYNAPDHRYTVGLGIFDIFDPSRPMGMQYPRYTERKWTVRRVGLNQGKTSVWAALDVIKRPPGCKG